MAEELYPAWLEACGFVRTRGYRATDCLYEKFFDQDRRYGLTASFDASLKADICMMGPGREVIALMNPTRSAVRSAWHALTGTRLVEPMPTDIAESTLILADKYEEDGFGDQAAYIRSLVSDEEGRKRDIDELVASAIDTEIAAITSQLPRPRFANDSYRFRYCEQCRGCTQHIFLSQATMPSLYECLTCRKSGYVAPVDATRRVPMIRSSAGLRPAFDGERVDGFALAKDLEDALNHVTEFKGELFPASGEHQPNAYS